MSGRLLYKELVICIMGNSGVCLPLSAPGKYLDIPFICPVVSVVMEPMGPISLAYFCNHMD